MKRSPGQPFLTVLLAAGAMVFLPAASAFAQTLVIWDEFNYSWSAKISDPNIQVEDIHNGHPDNPYGTEYGPYIYRYGAIGNPPYGLGWVAYYASWVTDEDGTDRPATPEEQQFWKDTAWTPAESLTEAEASNPKSYFEVTIYPVGGALMTLESFSLDWRDSGYGPRKWALRSSQDGYAQNLAAGEFEFLGCTTDLGGEDWTHDLFQNLSVPLGAQFEELDSPVTFRFYGYALSYRTFSGVWGTTSDGYGYPICNDTLESGWLCTNWDPNYCQSGSLFFDNLEIQGTTRLPVTDEDGDGVLDDDDLCAGTEIPEGVPTRRLGTNRFALVDDDGVFDTRPPAGTGPRKSFTIEDTAGCSCEQIIAVQGLGSGHTKFGCSISAMEDWVALVTPVSPAGANLISGTTPTDVFAKRDRLERRERREMRRLLRKLRRMQR